jgi:hypothetical protein
MTTPVLRFTRAVYALGVCLTLGTGIGLFAFPARTSDYWAWTIDAPLTAAFFGAAYCGAAVSLALAARTPVWERTRVVAIAALTLTSLTLAATLRDTDPFAFGDGGLRAAVAWIWLAVYVALPPLLVAAFVLQERANGTRADAGDEPALLATRASIASAGAVLGLLGVGLTADWSWLIAHWPWPLPPLPAHVLGAWLCTFAASFLWFGLREREWSRVRVGIVPTMVAIGLALAAAARLSDGFHGGAGTAVYLGGLCTVFVLLGVATLVETRRGSGLRGRGPRHPTLVADGEERPEVQPVENALVEEHVEEQAEQLVPRAQRHEAVPDQQ